jgi:uncharacterized membrane protein YdjX (TVP38/TMEM64 family)
LSQAVSETSSTGRTGNTGRARLGWLVASLAALPYFVFSLVLVLNSTGNANGRVWLPSFPEGYYKAKTLLEAPLAPYFALFDGFRNNPGVSYMQYTYASRGPILLLTLVLIVTAIVKLSHRRPSRSPRRVRLGGAQLALLGGTVAALALYLAVPPLRLTINQGVALLDPRNIGPLRAFLLGLGPWAPAVSFLLMVLQSVAAPLPAFVITIANGAIFGAFWGTLLSWSSAMAGAALCYGIARALGRPVVERLVGAGPLAKSDAIFDRYGTHAVLIARLIPLISFDVVSYAAGLTRVGLVPFLVATGVGQLPATVVYSMLGENIGSGASAALWTVGALASLVVIGVALRGRIERQIAGRASRPSELADSPAI